MKQLREFLLVSTVDKWLLIKAALLLEVTKLSMRLLPFQVLQRLLARAAGMPVRGVKDADRASVAKVVWAVEVASQCTLGVKTCLNQALVAQVLLARRGYPAHLHIGVAKGKRGDFQAHAWVESQGKVVIGGAGLERFVALAVLKEKRPGEFRE